MIRHSRLVLAALLGLALAGCTSGSNPPTCSLNDPAQLPPTPAPNSAGSGSAWPKFRANVQNTGTVSNVTVSINAAVKMMFPTTPDGKGAFIASPVLNTGEAAIYIGSTDHTVYKLSTTDLSQDPTFNLVLSQPITSTAVAAFRDGQDAVFVGAGDGFLYAANQTGGAQENYWPFPFNGYISASPTIGLSDGTVYVGTENGVFGGICPNGIARFLGSTTSIESSAAIGPDSTVYIGSDDRQLRALQNYGPLKWAFAASAPIVAAPVVGVEATGTFVYAADLGGRVFKVNATTGLPVAGFNFPSVMPISSSPALANNHLYFGSDDGSLYAISTIDGSVVWRVPTGEPIVSSPAVAIATDQLGNLVRVIVVVGSKDGNLYFVEDDGSPTPPYAGLPLCPQAIVAGGRCDGGLCRRPPCMSNQSQPIESSPAIGSDGTVYIGTDGGRVYAIR